MDKIAFAIGTRAELIKIFPVLQKMKDYVLIHTGQHEIGDLLSAFRLREPDVVLSKPPEKTTKFYFDTWSAAKWALGMTKKIGQAAKENGAKVLVYHGDTMTTAAAAISAARHRLVGVHLEAGLRSGSLAEPYPEELSRIIADSFSKVAFAVSEKTKKNLENAFFFHGKIVNTGNTIVDSAWGAYKMSRGKIAVPDEEYAVVTAHRQENLRSYERMLAIARIAKNSPIPAYFFVHDNTIEALKKFGIFNALAKKVKLVKISNYVSFIHWIAKSRVIFTDGGSIQEESLVFRKPCFLLRNRTERIEGLETGINFLTKFDVEKTGEKVKEVLSESFRPPDFVNPYGAPGTSRKVVDELELIARKVSKNERHV